VNDEICHGIPDKRVLAEGDIVAIDIGLRYKSFCGDSCVTYAVGTISPEVQRLLKVTERCLYKGIAAAQLGHRLSDIGAAIQAHAESHGYSVVREWGGHGIGRNLHEPPRSCTMARPGAAPGCGRHGVHYRADDHAGRAEWKMLKDGWTVVTEDGALSAQFEHTIAITDHGPEILSKL